jgi:hypothetical protein
MAAASLGPATEPASNTVMPCTSTTSNAAIGVIKPIANASATPSITIKSIEECALDPAASVANVAQTAKRSSNSPMPGAPLGKVTKSFCTVAGYREGHAGASREPGYANSPERGVTASIACDNKNLGRRPEYTGASKGDLPCRYRRHTRARTAFEFSRSMTIR